MSQTDKRLLLRIFLSHHFFLWTRFKYQQQDETRCFVEKWKESTDVNITGGRTFRENHKMWLRIQDTTISYLIARNPRLKKTNRVHYEQSLQQLLQWHLITNIISLTCLCLCLFVLSSLSPGTWRGECPAWPCLPGWVSLPVGAKVASSPHRPDNQRDMMCDRI